MGLLNDPEQQMGLLSNPMFNAGMGLLSSSYDPNINPWQAAMGGIAGAQQNKQTQQDRKRIEELRKQLAQLISQQQRGMQGMPPGAMQPGMDSPSTMGGGGGSYVDQVLRDNAWRNIIGGVRNG